MQPSHKRKKGRKGKKVCDIFSFQDVLHNPIEFVLWSNPESNFSLILRRQISLYHLIPDAFLKFIHTEKKYLKIYFSYIKLISWICDVNFISVKWNYFLRMNFVSHRRIFKYSFLSAGWKCCDLFSADTFLRVVKLPSEFPLFQSLFLPTSRNYRDVIYLT